jgi:hypothetical protein
MPVSRLVMRAPQYPRSLGEVREVGTHLEPPNNRLHRTVCCAARR